MARFAYTARTKAGERVEGFLEAQDRHAAMMQLEKAGFVPVRVIEAAGGAAAEKGSAPAKPRKRMKLEFGHRTPRMPMREVLLLTRELSDLIASGMTLGNALHTLTKRRSTRDVDTITAALRDDIVQGANLSDALAKWPRTFSRLYVSMVRAGEVSGQLAEVLERLSAHFERVQEARDKVVSALIYPAIVLTMGIGTMIFTLIFVVPRFSKIFLQLGRDLPGPTKMLIGLSSGMLRYGWILAILIAVGVVALRRFVRTEAGQRWWGRVQMRLPVIHRIVTANAFSHFARTLGTLLANGVPVIQALSILEDTTGNAVIADAIHDARDRVTDGATISGPLAQGKVFPPLLTDMLTVGEQTGDLSGALGHIAVRYDKELDRAVKILTTVLEPILILLMALMVGFVAVSMLLAVFDLTSGLKM